MPHIYLPVNEKREAGDYVIGGLHKFLNDIITSDIWGNTRFDDGSFTISKGTILKVPQNVYDANGNIVSPPNIVSQKDHIVTVAFTKNDAENLKGSNGVEYCTEGTISLIPVELIMELNDMSSADEITDVFVKERGGSRHLFTSPVQFSQSSDKTISIKSKKYTIAI